LRYIALLSMVVFSAALLGCAGNRPLPQEPGKEMRSDTLPNRLDLSLVREKHPEFYGKFEKAVGIVDGFIRERKFFTSGFDVEKASLKLLDDRLYLNGEEVTLTRGSLVISMIGMLSPITPLKPRASAAPGRMSFRVYGSGEDEHHENSLFYDRFKKNKFRQESDALGMARLICHEIVHVVQFKRDGAGWYYGEYVMNFIYNIFNPLTYFGKNWGPYRRIGYEVEARKYARALYSECREMFERSLERKPDAR